MKIVNSLMRGTMAKLLSISLVALLVFLTACSGNGNTPADSGNGGTPANSSNGSTPADSNDDKPIKIGVLTTLTGPFAAIGETVKKGIELYFEQTDYKIGNRKVELIIEDEEFNPQVAIRKFNKLADSDKIDFLIGMSAGNVLYALRDQVDTRKIPSLAVARGNEIAWGLKSDYIYRVVASNYQMGYAAAPYALKHLGKKAYLISYDNPSGYEFVAGFKSAFEAGGGEIVKAEYPKAGTTDFATYLTQVAQLKPDFVYGMGPAADAMRLALQFKEFGLKDKIPFLTQTPPNLATTPEMLAALNGAYVTLDYNETLDNETNKKFVAAFEKKYGKKITDAGAEMYGYDSAMTLAKAIEQAGSAKPEDVIKALKGISIDSTRGTFTIDPKTNNAILDVYIEQYRVKDGKLVKDYLDTTKAIKMPETNPDKK
jgi:branched-chain amino acid transport system substrate-binding protein